MQYNTAKPKVFISYSRHDGEAFATLLREELTEAQIPLWQDRVRMEGGEDWWLQIESALNQVQIMVLIATPDAMYSETVRKEWRYARQAGVRIYPVKPPGVELDFSKLPRWIRTSHFYDYAHPDQHTLLFEHLLMPFRPPPRAIFMVETNPEDLVHRPQEFEAVVQLLLDETRENPVAITAALRGAGGYGKTTLARAICHHEAIKEAFDDGILWVTLGENPSDLIGYLADLIYRLTNERPGFSSLEAARSHLKEILENRDILLVVDDVWKPEHLKPFIGLSKQCALLVTTRYESALPQVAKRVHVDEMGEQEALQLLCYNIDPIAEEPRLYQLVKRLGRWPLLLKLVNGVLRNRMGIGQSFTEALTYVEKALDKKGLNAFNQRNTEDRNLAVSKTLDITFQLLKPEEYTRYRELAIFHDDADVPLATLAEFWRATGGMDETDTEELCTFLHDLSLLLKLDLNAKTVRLHDVIRTYLITLPVSPSSEDSGWLQSLHGQFLDAFQLQQWSSLATTEMYLWTYLAYHLKEAGRLEELRDLLLNLDWFETKLAIASPNALLADFAYLPDDPDTTLIQAAVRLSAHILARDKAMLKGQLYGRLMSYQGENPTITSILNQIRQTITQPILLPLTPSLDQAGDPLLRVLTGHVSHVTALAITPDGKHAISTSGEAFIPTRVDLISHNDFQSDNPEMAIMDNTIRIWDIKDGNQLNKLSLHERPINDIAISSDGKWCVSVSDDLTGIIWSFPDGKILHRLTGHQRPIGCVAISSDNRWVLTGSFDTTLKLWDSQTGELLQTLSGHKDGVLCLAITPNNAYAISGARDNSLMVWDLKTGDMIQQLKGHNQFVSSVTAMSDNRRCVSGAWDKSIRIWDITTGQQLDIIKGHQGLVAKVLVTHDDQRVISGAWDNTIKIWDIETKIMLDSLPEHDHITALAISKDSTLLVSATHSKNIKLWELTRHSQTRTQAIGHTSRVSGLTALENRRQFISASWDSTLKLWDMDSFKEVTTFHGHTGAIRGATLTPDGKHILSASNDMTVKLWDIETGKVTQTFSGDTEQVLSVASSDDGHYVIAGSKGAVVRVWDRVTGQQLRRVGEHTRGIRSILSLPERQLVILVSGMDLPGVDRPGAVGRYSMFGLGKAFIINAVRESKVIIYDFESGRFLRALLQGEIVFCMATSPDYQNIAIGTWYERIKVYRVDDASLQMTLEGHKWLIESIIYAPNGQFLVSVAQDRTVRLWDMVDGACLAIYHFDESLTACLVMPDNKTIVVGGESGRLYFLELVKSTTV